jgi:hypothetical protein
MALMMGKNKGKATPTELEKAETKPELIANAEGNSEMGV